MARCGGILAITVSLACAFIGGCKSFGSKIKQNEPANKEKQSICAAFGLFEELMKVDLQRGVPTDIVNSARKTFRRLLQKAQKITADQQNPKAKVIKLFHLLLVNERFKEETLADLRPHLPPPFLSLSLHERTLPALVVPFTLLLLCRATDVPATLTLVEVNFPVVRVSTPKGCFYAGGFHERVVSEVEIVRCFHITAEEIQEGVVLRDLSDEEIVAFYRLLFMPAEYKDQEDREKALSEVHFVRRRFPKLLITMSGEAAILLCARKFREAEKLLKQAIALAPNRPGLHALYLEALAKQNKDEEALRHISQLPRWIRTRPKVAVWEGIILCRNMRYAEALEPLGRAFDEEALYGVYRADVIETLCKRAAICGLALDGASLCHKAVQKYKRFLGEGYLLHLLQAACLLVERKYSDALASLEKALQKAHQQDEFRMFSYDAGLLLWAHGGRQQRTSDPAVQKGLNMLADFLINVERELTAKKEQYTKEGYGYAHSSLVDTIAVLKYGARRYREAIPYFRLLVKCNRLQGLYGQGICYAKLGEYYKALALLKSCLAVCPENSPDHKRISSLIDEIKALMRHDK